MGQPVKIQINSLEALERLIGGDSELEIEIRNAIVQEFSKKHLKAIAQNSASWAEDVARNAVQKYLEDYLGKWTMGRWGPKVFELNTHTKMVLEEASQGFLREILEKIVDEKIKSKDLDKITHAYIDTKFNVKINDLVNQKVNEKIAKITEGLSK